MRTLLIATVSLPMVAHAQAGGAGAVDYEAPPLTGLDTPAGEIEVPPDPQAGIPGAVEYHRSAVEPPERPAAAGGAAGGDVVTVPDEGGLVGESALGEAVEGSEGDEGDDGADALPPYRGVRPGAREKAAPYEGLLGRKQTYVTWIGFEPGVDRVFVQLSRQVDYTITKGQKGELVLDLHGARIGAENDTRPLDLAHFDTVVSRVWAKPIKGGDTRLFIELKEHSPYRLERKGRYIYVYFRG